jgi:hypothetical protein
MNAGASFGDRTMNLLNDKRTASVASTMDVELLRIEKADFFDVIYIFFFNKKCHIFRLPMYVMKKVLPVVLQNYYKFLILLRLREVL